MLENNSTENAYERCGSLRCEMAHLDEHHAAWIAGREHGLAEGQRMAAEHLAAELLHRQACDMLGLATTAARGRHGEAWAAEIERAAS